ncbi:hypothetical protein [Streptomyces sp. NPDC052287]|uniref:hypothetical protein n=1 Tax=unclassified Streptomyces TaxID=2593676 RepID=UPI00341D00EA
MGEVQARPGLPGGSWRCAEEECPQLQSVRQSAAGRQPEVAPVLLNGLSHESVAVEA